LLYKDLQNCSLSILSKKRLFGGDSFLKSVKICVNPWLFPSMPITESVCYVPVSCG